MERSINLPVCKKVIKQNAVFTDTHHCYQPRTKICTTSVNLCSALPAVVGLIRVYFDMAGTVTVRYCVCVKHVTNMGTQWLSASVTDGGSEACGSVWKGVLRSDVI